ncbi:cytochrome P450 2B11-like [Macaca fascicularis]|uniref:cytochrome P450 2B11-like n=1 Tax=Macaca fascicularis TaxID=9541 RepID=UPI003D15DC86
MGERNFGSVELSGRWGPVFTAQLGPRPAVVLCGYAALRDALVLQADAFSGRGSMAVFERFTRGHGILFSNGPRRWTLRNFAVGALKELGLGTRTIQAHVLEEAACLLDEMQATIGAAWLGGQKGLVWEWPLDCQDGATGRYLGGRKPVSPWGWLGAGPRIMTTVLFQEPRLTPCDFWIMLYPMLSVLVFGNRYGYGDPEFLRLLNLFSDNFRIMSSRWGEVPGTRQRARLLCPQQQQDPESHFQEETSGTFVIPLLVTAH